MLIEFTQLMLFIKYINLPRFLFHTCPVPCLTRFIQPPVTPVTQPEVSLPQVLPDPHIHIFPDCQFHSFSYL